MQHKADILDAIATHRLSDIEDAFRALVDWPGADIVMGLEGTSDALDLLKAVCDALSVSNDTRTMPGDVIDLLNGMAEGPEMVGAPWYAAGAAFVRDRLPRWRPFFVRTFGEE